MISLFFVLLGNMNGHLSFSGPGIRFALFYQPLQLCLDEGFEGCGVVGSNKGYDLEGTVSPVLLAKPLCRCSGILPPGPIACLTEVVPGVSFCWAVSFPIKMLGL